MDNRCGNQIVSSVARGIGVVGILLCVGCGESKEQLQTKRDLMDIGLTYHMFHADRGRGPHNAEELLAYRDPAAGSLPGNAATQSGVKKALQSGNYVVIWDVEILLPAERNSGKVLAYHRDVPEKGGMVVYQDGFVAALTREEFERAPKAQPAPDPKK
jgi:hypothetical protein